MANDEEALRAAAEAAEGKPVEKEPPSWATWTTTDSMLAQLIVDVRALQSILIQVNSKPGRAAPKVEPPATPQTAMVRISMELRLSKHKALVGRLLGKRDDPQD